MDFENMEKNIEAERAEKDKRSIEALNRMSEETIAYQNAWNEELYRAVASEKNAKAEMSKEIADIQAEADKRVQQVKDRYSATYGRTDWNSSLDDSFKDLARDVMKNH